MIDTNIVLELDRAHSLRVTGTWLAPCGDGWNEPAEGPGIEDLEVFVVRKRRDGREVERRAEVGDRILTLVEQAVLEQMEDDADDRMRPAPRRTHGVEGCEFPQEACRCAAIKREAQDRAADRAAEDALDFERESRA